MPNNAAGVTELADFIPELWANDALGYLPNYTNLAKTVNRNYDDSPMRVGDTLYIPKRGSLTANQKSADTTVTKQFPSSDKVTVNLDQHWEVSFVIEDIALAQSNQDVMRGYTQDAAMKLGEKIEETIAAEYSNAGTQVTTGTNIDDKLLLVRKAFADNKVPKNQEKFLYASPEEMNSILDLDRFINAEKYGSNTPIMDGEIGSIYGMKIFESQLVPESGSPVVRHNIGYTRDALVLAVRPLPSHPSSYGVNQAVITDPETGIAIRVSASYNADYLAVQVTLDVLFGVAAMRSEHLIDLQIS